MPDYFDTGFTVREASWHRKELILDDWPGSWDEAWAAANGGYPWDILVEPAYRLSLPSATFHKSGYNYIVRDDNLAVLSQQGPDYSPITNAEFGEVIAAVMEAYGEDLRFETAVVLRGGRVIAVTMYLPEERRVPGDPSAMRMYFVFMVSHDKTVALKGGKSIVRIVCWNTQQAAENELDRRKSGFVIKHTLNWRERRDQVLAEMTRLREEEREFMEWATDQAAFAMTEAKVSEFLDRWIPWSTDMTPRQLDFVMGRRAQFLELLNESVTTEGIRGTKWGVYQAAVELCDHYTNSRSLDSEITRQLLTGDDRKASAVRVLARI